MPRGREFENANIESLNLPVNARPYKVSDDGIVGYRRNKLEFISPKTEADDVLSLARDIANHEQFSDERRRVVFETQPGGDVKIITDKKRTDQIVNGLIEKGYLDEETLSDLIRLFNYSGNSEIVASAVLTRARLVASRAGENYIKSQIRRKRRTFI